MIHLWHGDCLREMYKIVPGSINGIFVDLPYGITKNEWDTVLPIGELWEHWERLLTPDGMIVLFGQQPFTSEIVTSKRDWFYEEIIIRKPNKSNFLNANRMHIREHENVLIFRRGAVTYNPQMKIGQRHKRGRNEKANQSPNYGKRNNQGEVDSYEYYPTSIVDVKQEQVRTQNKRQRIIHPTEKSVDCMKYLIRTYSNENDVILDCCMGTGAGGVACVHLNRHFYGIEMNEAFYETACRRIRLAQGLPMPIDETHTQLSFLGDMA